MGNNKQESGQNAALALLFELAPAAWLVLVLCGYALVVFVPPPRRTAEIPGLVELERAVLPLLAILGLIAIIRYFSLRKQGYTDALCAAESSPEGRDTP